MFELLIWAVVIGGIYSFLNLIFGLVQIIAYFIKMEIDLHKRRKRNGDLEKSIKKLREGLRRKDENSK